ncbi:hypothetical protein GCM10010116_21020 [Microbispora rosea subsp. aerata]|nr:hypothetical protein [Microbispora rosea]GGO10448.1 hypothetical protein GCM10010116_21020 [Microbispora rosea subsp. aerata]GIH53715.1 hypothetical protein Mro02_06290 [Microbispora rosea subsp. aerata]GLJ81708.1 hypothetical protein GCM10017588_04330 [Microbispora rosea subsp. aerata]
MQPIRLTPAHKMMASAVLVGVVIVGGASVTAAAFAGRLDKAAKADDAPREVTSVDFGRGEVAGPRAGAGAGPEVVPEDFAGDPDESTEYWTPERLQEAYPLEGPEVTVVIPD